jgi:Flp pilus assembly protein TadB
MIARLKLWLAVAGAAIIALAVAFLKGRASGAAEQANKSVRVALDAAKQRKRVDVEIDRLSDDAVRQRMRDRWQR